jgi:hypothetical protein
MALTGKTFRIFVSSTFGDLVAEHNAGGTPLLEGCPRSLAAFSGEGGRRMATGRRLVR